MPGVRQCFEHLRKVLHRDAKASHARVDLQVNGMLCNSECCSRLVEGLDLPSLPHGWRELQTDDFVFLAAPETRHEQDVGLNSCFVQRDCFIERRDAQPLCALSLQRVGALDRAMPVGVGLHDGANCDALSDMLLNCAKVLPKSGERNICPRRTRCCAAYDFCGCGHFRDYSGSSRCVGGYAGATPCQQQQCLAPVPDRPQSRILPRTSYNSESIQFCPSMKFTVIWVSTSIASPLRMYGR